MTEDAFDHLLAQIDEFAQAAPNLAALQNYIVEIIPAHLPYYDWTGFYMLAPDCANMLILGPFRGAPTEHIRIPVGEGICGAAVSQNSTVVVDEVASDPRYIACSVGTRSEIVTPIRVHGAVVGEIDVDSHTPAAFSARDRKFLESCAAVVGRFIERTQPAIPEA